MPVVPAVVTDRYYRNQEIGDYLGIAEEAAPHLLRLYTIGTSFEGKPLYLAEITNRASGEARDKPACWVDGGWRGGQLLGSSACLELVRQLTSHYGRDAWTTDLLDYVTFYVCPRLAADASDLCLQTGEWCWSSTRPDGAQEPGLRPSDINGDGRSLQMRLLDPLGGWKISRRDPRLLIPRGPEDRQGSFYRLLSEGLIDPEADRLNPPSRARNQLDLERNFPGGDWDPQICGPYPLSEPETRVVADFFRDHPNLCAVVSFANLGQGITLAETPGMAVPIVHRLGKKLQEWTGLPVSHRPIPGFSQWAHQHQGLLVLRCQPWNLARTAGLEQPERALEEVELANLLRWLDQYCPTAFQAWTPFEHPQLGPVEIGGWNWLYSWLNPPPGALLQAELERFTKLVLATAQTLPRLQVQSFQDTTLGWTQSSGEIAPDAFQPLRKVRLVLENKGYLPTWMCGPNQGAGLALHLSCEPGCRLVMGQEYANAGQLLGVGVLEGDHPLPLGPLAGGDWPARLEREWLVEGSGRIHLEVRHPRAGARQVSLGGERPVNPPPYQAPTPAPMPPPPPPPVSRSLPQASRPASPPPVPQPPPLPPPQPVAKPAVPGRVLGSPPAKVVGPMQAFAAQVRESLQGSPAKSGDGFEPFSPGLPLRSNYPGSPQPVDSPASVEFDELPPDPGEGRVLNPLLLRKREKGK